MSYNPVLKIVRFFLYLIPLAGLFWLINQYLVTSGELTVNYDLQHPSPFISELVPKQRVGEIEKTAVGNYYQVLLAEPVYFDCQLPRNFTSAQVRVKFINQQNQELLLGVGGSGAMDGFLFKPLDYQPLNQLFNDKFHWSSQWLGDLVLLQRGQEFKGVQDFLNSWPTVKEQTVVYNYDLLNNFILADYQPRIEKLEINHSLRGGVQIFTYLKNEPLDFTFYWQDVNRHPNVDEFTIKVYSLAGDEVFSQLIPDDGISEATQTMSAISFQRLLVPDLSEGAYKIVVAANNDIFIRKIITQQHLVVFNKELFIADEVGYLSEPQPVDLYTDGSKLGGKIVHLEGPHQIKVGWQSLLLDQVHQDYLLDIDQTGLRDLTAIQLPKNDIFLQTDGVFAFQQENYFNPLPIQLKSGQNLEKAGIKYVLATYPLRELAGEWETATVNFDLSQLPNIQKQQRFVFSLPYLTSAPDIKISDIIITWKRNPFDWTISRSGLTRIATRIYAELKERVGFK